MITATMAQMMSIEDDTGAPVIDQDIWMIGVIHTRTCTTMGTVMKAGSGDGMTMTSPETAASMLTMMVVEGDPVALTADITEVGPGAGREMLGNPQTR